LPDYPGYVARQLQFAAELSSYDATLLWTMGIERLGSEFFQPKGSVKAESDPESGGTIGRRKRLLGLFDRHPRLTRAHVVALLPCSRNTATRDLEALASEGHIKRVMTSGHLRTSYFVRVGPSTLS
jgi:hypothetical protein